MSLPSHLVYNWIDRNGANQPSFPWKFSLSDVIIPKPLHCAINIYFLMMR